MYSYNSVSLKSSKKCKEKVFLWFKWKIGTLNYKLDMDVEDAKKISVKYALCDFQYETGCLKLKKKITKTKILS